MKLLIATPAYNGIVHAKFVISLFSVMAGLRNAKLGHEIYFLENESLIPRARNKCVKYALQNGFTHLLFIDADLVFTWENLKSLILAGRPIVGGTYPIKMLPIKYNFNPLPEHLADFGEDRSIEAYVEYVRKHADSHGLVEVAHLPTGFLLIETQALRDVQGRIAEYASFEPATGKVEQYWDFFPSGPKAGRYLSEDWGFSELVRDAGIKIFLHAHVTLGHIGSFTYRGDLTKG